jgi:hypothetical protein
VVLNRTALRDLRPLASFGSYLALMAVQLSSPSAPPRVEHTAAVFYGDGRQSVISSPAPEATLGMVQFMFGDKGTAGTVHGHDALGLMHGSGPFGELNRSTVMWWEGGRLVAVTGGSDLATTFELAESVRPATDAEWSQP